jgi:hypothetical protein
VEAALIAIFHAVYKPILLSDSIILVFIPFLNLKFFITLNELSVEQASTKIISKSLAV